LIIGDYPYIAVYRLHRNALEVLAIIRYQQHNVRIL